MASGRAILSITWSAPASDIPIQNYEVQYRVNGTASWVTLSPNPTTTSANLLNLQLGTVYQVRVRAVSDLGNGAWSNSVLGTTFDGKDIYIHKYIYVYTYVCPELVNSCC